MVNEKMLALGTKRSCIRELFEYGLKQAAIVGKENVFDYSLGNPSIPAPPPVNKAFVGIVETMDSLAVHGYTPAPGAPDARKAVVDELNARYGVRLRPENLFFTCGAAPSPSRGPRSSAWPPSSPSTRPLWSAPVRPSGSSPPTAPPSRSTWPRWRPRSMRTPRP